MLLRHVTFAKYLPLAVMGALLAPLAPAASFGRVVTIGGHVSDIALDESRGVLYAAVYTASRVDVLSVADYSIGRSISVAAYPGALALSPDGRYLVVTHYANFGGTPTNGIPAPAMSSSLAYFDAYRSTDLPQNLTQAQRDYFGAHTYQRNDKGPDAPFVHTDWSRYS